MTAIALAAGVAVQGILLWNASGLKFPEAIQYWAALAFVAALVMELWRWRRYLNPHADMLLIMFAMGGAGMGFGGMSCHITGWADWLRMNGLMLSIGLAPAVPLSRCLQAARREGTLLSTLLLDGVGMLAGMKLASLVSLATLTPWASIVSHAVIMTGMIAGMGVAMALPTFFGNCAPRTNGGEA